MSMLNKLSPLELSRTLPVPDDNPNKLRPKLGLGKRRKEECLQIGEVAENSSVSGNSRICSDPTIPLGEGELRQDAWLHPREESQILVDEVRDGCVDQNPNIGENAMRETRTEPIASADLSRPHRLSRVRPLPFILIPGSIFPGEPSFTDPRGRTAALNIWIKRIVRDVGRTYSTHSERTAAEAFVCGHRLSIANAFERKLVRGDVVAELTRLFQLEIKAKDGDQV